MDFKTVFIIAIATYRMVFPGLPPVVPKPGAELTSIPATRSLTMELYSDRQADAQCKAEVIVPSGLNLGGPARLFVDLRPKPSDSVSSSSSRSKTDEGTLINKSYWGCCDSVPQGQPRVIKSSEIAGDDGSAEPQQSTVLPAGSYAFWPGPDTEPLDENASTPGKYTLNTNYCGSASVTVGQDQNFMGAIELVDVPKKPDLDRPIKVTWKPVPNALAYILNAYGGSGHESVDWTSSAEPTATAGIEARALTREEIARLIERKALLPPDATTCTVPAGIFKGSWSVFLTVTAIGADKIESKDGVETRVLVRSVASVPLAGTTYKPMPEPEEEKK